MSYFDSPATKRESILTKAPHESDPRRPQRFPTCSPSATSDDGTSRLTRFPPTAHLTYISSSLPPENTTKSKRSTCIVGQRMFAHQEIDAPVYATRVQGTPTIRDDMYPNKS